MRSLAMLGLIVLSTLPLAARDRGWHRGWHARWAEPRARVWVERGRWADRDRCEDDDRYVYRPRRWEPRYDCDDDDEVVVVRPLPRPLPPPWRSRVVLRFGW